MKRILWALLLWIPLLTACASQQAPAQIAATTLPVYEFTAQLCDGTGITVTRLVTEEVSCLHDYALNVRQVKAAEAAQVIVISGAGLEVFLGDLLETSAVIDASTGISLLCPAQAHTHEAEEPFEHEDHHHDQDPHIWLSPENAAVMAQNIAQGLSRQYPEHQSVFESNLAALMQDLSDLQNYGETELSQLKSRELITFHDGFSYFADCFDLTILDAVEEESGSEASARELIHLIEEVEHHNIKAVFTEKSGSVSAAGILARETGCGHFSLDMAMAGDSYFEAMYHNIDTIKEALG